MQRLSRYVLKRTMYDNITSLLDWITNDFNQEVGYICLSVYGSKEIICVAKYDNGKYEVCEQIDKEAPISIISFRGGDDYCVYYVEYTDDIIKRFDAFDKEEQEKTKENLVGNDALW